MLNLLSQPKQQTAEATIFTLCDRLANSKLQEDRKAAVLALKGLAREHRELVASSGLRGLLNALILDFEDLDTCKSILETLLVLLNTDAPRRKVLNKVYVSPLRAHQTSTHEDTNIVNDIALWLTDELLQTENTLQVVLKIIDKETDPFCTVYALQLISAMTANRPTLTKSKLIELAGLPVVMACVRSVHDMVRDETLLLLTALSEEHLDMQKLVAFEGIFDSLFEILLAGGTGAVFGGRLAEDCLSLLSSLIMCNQSNQKLFVQSGYALNWCKLLTGILDALNDGVNLREQQILNIELSLQIGQLLLVPGADQTEENQRVLHKAGALQLVLQIAFESEVPLQVRVSALLTVSALVNSMADLQADLLSLDVPYHPLTFIPDNVRVVPVAQALLNYALNLNSTHMFDLRVAALECLTSSFSLNSHAKFAFIHDQIEGYKSNLHLDDANLVAVLGEHSDQNDINPFRVWFACALAMRLFLQSPESKEQLMNVKIGDESLGMEVHSLLQAVGGAMQVYLDNADPTVALGYLQLLIYWLYDDVDAVNELVKESSVVQALLGHKSPNVLVTQLSVICLGTMYTFSTPNSSLPRHRFHDLLVNTLGKDQYMLHIRQFRQSPLFTNFDLNDMFKAPKLQNGNPAVYIDIPFVDLMREHISYISRAINANPNIEPSSKVTLEMLDDVKNELHLKNEKLQIAETKLVETESKISSHEQEIEKLKKEINEFNTKHSERKTQLEEIKAELETLKPEHVSTQNELTSVKEKLKESDSTKLKLQEKLDELKLEVTNLTKAKEKNELGVNNMTREIFQLQRSKEQTEKEVQALKSSETKLKLEIKQHLAKIDKLKQTETKTNKELDELRPKLKQQLEEQNKLKEINEKLVSKLKETASDLKEREEEEEELKELLKEEKVKKEDALNELVGYKNREGQVKKELALAKSKLDEKQNELKDSQQSSSKLKDLNAQLLKQISELKNNHKDELNKLKGDIDERQETLDGLMVLLDDLTEKKQKYKERLRAKNEDVSESESEDE